MDQFTHGFLENFCIVSKCVKKEGFLILILKSHFTKFYCKFVIFLRRIIPNVRAPLTLLVLKMIVWIWITVLLILASLIMLFTQLKVVIKQLFPPAIADRSFRSIRGPKDNSYKKSITSNVKTNEEESFKSYLGSLQILTVFSQYICDNQLSEKWTTKNI